ncbi:MAG: hypothetical protein ACXW0R_05595 [Gaiellaceae bacterium]
MSLVGAVAAFVVLVGAIAGSAIAVREDSPFVGVTLAFIWIPAVLVIAAIVVVSALRRPRD